MTIVVALVVLTVASSARADEQPIVDVIDVPTAFVRDVVVGPDGDLYFQADDNVIGQRHADGRVDLHPTGGTSTDPMGFRYPVVGPDQAIWFSTAAHRIGRLDPQTGAITVFTVTTTYPAFLAVGPEGDIWFGSALDIGGGGLEHLSMSGTAISADGPRMLSGLTAGPDGNIWATSALSCLVDRIDPVSGTTTATFSVPDGGVPGEGCAARIAAGPDGNLWFIGMGGIGRMTTSGAFTSAVMLQPGEGIWAMRWAADGNLWFVGDGRLRRLSLDGAIDVFELPGMPYGYAIASDATSVYVSPDGTSANPHLLAVAAFASAAVVCPANTVQDPTDPSVCVPLVPVPLPPAQPVPVTPIYAG